VPSTCNQWYDRSTGRQPFDVPSFGKKKSPKLKRKHLSEMAKDLEGTLRELTRFHIGTAARLHADISLLIESIEASEAERIRIISSIYLFSLAAARGYGELLDSLRLRTIAERAEEGFMQNLENPSHGIRPSGFIIWAKERELFMDLAQRIADLSGTPFEELRLEKESFYRLMVLVRFASLDRDFEVLRQSEPDLEIGEFYTKIPKYFTTSFIKQTIGVKAFGLKPDDAEAARTFLMWKLAHPILSSIFSDLVPIMMD